MKTECVIMTLQQDSPTDLLLKENLNKFWNYESLGIIKQNEHRYEVSFRMKQDHPVIPDNYISAQA